MVFDGRSELSSEDLEIISYSRKFNKPILTVINKTEGNFSQDVVDILDKMGLGETLRVSAAHNQSIDQLKWKIYNLIKDLNSSEESLNKSDDLTVAIVGKTNTGKSTITVPTERNSIQIAPGTYMIFFIPFYITFIMYNFIVIR